MADKQVLFDEAARAKLMRGVEELGRVVSLTLGPSGRNVILNRMWALPVVCSDGVTIAKEVELPEPYENMGAQLVKEAASKAGGDQPWSLPADFNRHLDRFYAKRLHPNG